MLTPIGRKLCFKTDADGRTVYYPWGPVLGKGYLVPAPEKKHDIQKQVERFYLVAWPLLIFANGIHWSRNSRTSLHSTLALGLVAFTLLGYAFLVRTLVRGLQVSPAEPEAAHYHFKAVAHSASWGSLILESLVLLALAAGGIALICDGEVGFGLSIALLFSASFTLLILTTRAKIMGRKQP